MLTCYTSTVADRNCVGSLIRKTRIRSNRNRRSSLTRVTSIKTHCYAISKLTRVSSIVAYRNCGRRLFIFTSFGS